MKNTARTALFLAAALAAAASPAASPLDDAVARGAKFLLSHQAEDGHFSDPHMPALTALPLWALVGAGATVVLNNGMSTEIRRLLESLLPLMGGVHFVTDESMLDAATGLSGSGPALLAMVAEAMADAGVAEGLPRDLARDLARETMLGTARLMEVQHPEVLKENVMSPHGTTAAGVLAAEKAGLRHAAAEFVSAASRRAREL